MTFTDDAWAATASIREAIYTMPFVRELGDGTLARDKFVYYMQQDALYLTDYSRSLSMLGASAATADEMEFWFASASGSLIAERALHARYVDVLDGSTMAPTCRAYTAFLLSLHVNAGHAVAAAGVLPCFWIYADVGEHLLAAAGDLDKHPYGDWIAMYADEAFAAEVEKAQHYCNALASTVDEPTYAAMIDAFVTAARYEWMFWDAGWRQEPWPV